jgi:hypothetical protein
VSTTFYEAVLPPTGLYCAVGIRGSRVITTFHDTLETLAQRGDGLVADGLNAYFALATFRDREAGRKAANAEYLQAFFLDVDAGHGKPYADQIEAAQALRAFVDATQLPPPTVVNSGRGLHVYWALTEPVAAADWKPLALALKELCQTHGLHTDPTVTADAARILRMPGTSNLKEDPPLLVAVVALGAPVPLERITQCLPEPVAPPPDLTAAKAFGMDALTASVAKADFPPSHFSRLVTRSLKGTGCAQIAHAVCEAATLEEPLWRAALSIAWRCDDAETAIHKLSSAHPEYTPEATLHKAQATRGPTTCAWYRKNYSERCNGCVHKITSPIQLGRKVEAAPQADGMYVVDHVMRAPDGGEGDAGTVVQVQIPAYPFPYFRGAKGGVYQRIRNADDTPGEIEIYKYDLYVTSRQYDSDEHGDGEGEQVTVHLHTPNDGIRQFAAPVAQLLVKEKMRDLLLRHGVIALDKELGQIMSYLASSIRNLQKLYSADRTRNQMGWTSDLTGFVVGELEYMKDGVRLAPASSATRSLAPLLIAKGSLAEWKEIMNFYARPGLETHALAIFFGMAAPLLRLYGGLEVRGAMINLMSNKSGTGKTTVQTMINSLFGHPTELLLKENDTILSRMQWMGKMNHIAITMDEMTNMSDEHTSNLIYDIPQGRGRHRMEAQSNRMRVNTTSWQTFVITSSNSSLYDKLLRLKSTADGELRRLIELRIARPSEINKAESDAVFRKLAFNYGLAGPKLVQGVMNDRFESDTTFTRFTDRFTTDLRLDQADRFHNVAFSAALTAGNIGRRLGLHEIPMGPVYRAATEHIERIKQEVIAPVSDTTRNATETLSEFLNENIPNTLVINNDRANGIPPSALHSPRGPLRVRFEPDTKEVWIPVNILREYFVTRQVDIRSAMRELAAMGVVKHDGAPLAKRVAAGALMGFDATSLRCFCFDAQALGVDTDAFPPPAVDDSR